MPNRFYRVTVATNCAVLVAASVALILGISTRSQAASWAGVEMVSVRWGYDLLGATLAVLALSSAVGLLARTKWALIGSITSSACLAFLTLGIPLLGVGLVYARTGVFDASLLALARVKSGTLLLGGSAVLDLCLLSSARFSREYLDR